MNISNAERVQARFQQNLREEIERQKSSGLCKDDSTHGYAVMAMFVRLVQLVNNATDLGKDDKFQLFICVATRQVTRLPLGG